MPFVATKFRRSSASGGKIWPWLAGGFAAVLLGGLYYLLATSGPRKIPERPPVVGRLAMNAEQRRMSDDIGESEKKFQRITTAKPGDPEAIAALDRAIARQRRLLHVNPQAGIEQNVRLERLIAAVRPDWATEDAAALASQLAGLSEGFNAASILDPVSYPRQMQEQAVKALVSTVGTGPG